MNVLLINLRSSSERLTFQKNQLNSLNLEFSVIEAVDSSELDENIFIRESRSWERPLRRAELACCLSHTFAWKKIIEENKPYLILEDDAILHKDTKSFLNYFKGEIQYDCINFETRNRRKILSKHKTPICKKYSISKIIHNKSGAAAYLLWPSGAKILYNYYKKNGAGLADALLSNCSSLKHFQVEPALAIQIDCCTHYKIKPPIETSSNISQEAKPNSKNSIIFSCRRLVAQFKVFCKLLVTIFSSESINVPFYDHTRGNE